MEDIENKLKELCLSNSLELVTFAKVGIAYMVIIKGKHAKAIIHNFFSNNTYKHTNPSITDRGLMFYIW